MTGVIDNSENTNHGTSSLYTLNIATGGSHPQSPPTPRSPAAAAHARSLAGLTSHGGELYVTTTGTSTGTGRIYRVDPDTLTGTQIGG